MRSHNDSTETKFLGALSAVNFLFRGTLKLVEVPNKSADDERISILGLDDYHFDVY